MSTQTVKIPQIGESVTEVTIGAWKLTEGQSVKTDQPLVDVESDKASVEVPSPAGGVLRKILVAAGETARIGQVIAEIEVGATADAPAAAPAAAAAPVSDVAQASPVAAASPRPVVPVNNGSVKASPSVRKMMAEHNIAASDVHATGPAGRIEREDVARAASAPTGDVVSAPARRTGSGAPRSARADLERVVPMTPMRKTVARRLLEAQQNAAILTTFNEINMESVMGLRKRYQDPFLARHGIKLGFMSFYVKAVVEALKAYPIVNAEVRGTDIVYKDYFDIGVAVGGGRGLVVPVVRDAHRLSLAEIEKTVAELATRARDNKLSLDELQGGSFTISNGGIYGSLLSTPILNPPQSGILGLHSIQDRPIALNGQVVIKPMMYVALSYDHRIVDGREAVSFLKRIKECIEDPERLLIEV
ncbi:MAG: 2-oxoglutarate dehydrogenase complex dihydrolipoyllysine-residue succinyltransferase [Deltaproteobacteria bacterium]|nr:2-oxoglutarate dehydrogenase complex dihydrolipoyllysine-residue succinyltransferase [Deltaproteobacteria bacterium]